MGAVFDSVLWDMDLIALFPLALDYGHRIIVVPSGAEDTWVGRQAQTLVYRDYLEFFQVDEGKTPSSCVVQIDDIGRSRWDQDPPRLTLQDARRLLERPLQVLVENGRNDGQFLKHFAPPPWRERLEEATEKKRLVYAHGGGRDLPKQLGPLLQDPMLRLRLFVVCDSDARVPIQDELPLEDQVGDVPREMICKCRDAQFSSYYVLRRRFIENYIPPEVLLRWFSNHTNNKVGQNAANAFKRLSDSAHRHHYNMKQGLRQDRKSIEARHHKQYEALWGKESVASLIGALEPGFGKDIAKLYQTHEHFVFEERWKQRDGQYKEGQALAERILALL